MGPPFSSLLCVIVWDEGQPASKTIIMLALLLPHVHICAGRWAGEFGWLGPPWSSVLANAQAGT